MDGYRIPDHVYLCKTREGILFLDLRDDRYLSVSGEELESLATLIPGWPISAPAEIPPDNDDRAKQVARALQDAGLLTANQAVGKSAHPPTLVPAVSSVLEQQHSHPRSRNAVVVLILLIYATLKVSLLLKFRSLESAIQTARQRKRKRDDPADILNGDLIARLTSDFLRLRPLVYSSRNKCLYDCLVLLEFLFRFDVLPTLVIGVTTVPFKAHCWLQHGTLVLTDYAEHTRAYTPILVV
jgi:transglutaminase superfamily protein